MAGLQKIMAVFWLSRKTSETYISSWKNLHLKKFTVNVWQKALIISLDGKKCTVLFTATVN